MYFEKDFPGGAIQQKTITPIGAAVTAAVCKSYYCNSLQEHNTEQRGRRPLTLTLTLRENDLFVPQHKMDQYLCCCHDSIHNYAKL